ncbi:putative dynamin-related protein 4A [Tetrabaena socialis]|uniref:Putative dynamin-related protein 4A n=1 Tax=Tetrabaena socialis TaxID=47790 RepID=A0A2J7ZN86_9CHLO|nr:putative dynamin-related protein 4A [Tetrabaena socialis]|eukprot:PNH01731.1 putative dynamin-related protein 4A [Tetrabaena socialis]
MQQVSQQLVSQPEVTATPMVPKTSMMPAGRAAGSHHRNMSQAPANLAGPVVAVNQCSAISSQRDELPIPRIVAIGDQSAGKSTVVSRILNIPLPSGIGPSTRTPLHIASRLGPAKAELSVPEQPLLMAQGDQAGRESWEGSKLRSLGWRRESGRYIKGLLLVDGQWPPGPEVVKTAVCEVTIAVAGEWNLMVDVELRLDWQSDTTPNLDIIDLPGLVLMPVAGQPDDMPQQIQSMVDKYILDKDTLIMCVLSGVDFDRYDSSKSDGDLSRTLVVITKLDFYRSAEEQLCQLRCLQEHPDNLDHTPIDVVVVRHP